MIPSQFRHPYEESLKSARPNLYRQLQESGELSRHLDEVTQAADQEFESICARLRDFGPEPTSNLGKANYAWMVRSQAWEMVMDLLRIRGDDRVADIDRNDDPERAEASPPATTRNGGQA